MPKGRLILGKYSIGLGDRFGQEGNAQLRAVKLGLDHGVEITPVWNKSHREHTIIGTEPLSLRQEAESAVHHECWKLPYFVDADHIGIDTVDSFLHACDFFTLDVADFIGRPASDMDIEKFVDTISPAMREIKHPALDHPILLTVHDLRQFAKKYMLGLREANTIYSYLKRVKGEGNFITEVSVDEASAPQSPAELYLFLASLAQMGVRVQTIAPKFSGSFFKGVDYVGDIETFSREFQNDIAVIDIAKNTFNLPEELKLSVHSGSDKFSLYEHIHKSLKKNTVGVHLKTAGTTWLEEIIGLATDPRGLVIAKKIYTQAFDRIDELQEPYEAVVRIMVNNLPRPSQVQYWSSDEYIAALQHEPKNSKLNQDFRQLLHISFRIAAEMGNVFMDGLSRSRSQIEKNVTDNLFRKHIKPLFLGDA